MTKSMQLLERLDRTFDGGLEGMVARKLMSFLLKNPDTSHITLQLVRQIAWERPDAPSDSVIVRTLQYLSAGENSVLETKFEIIEDENGDNSPHILSTEEIKLILSDGINPITGEYDPEIKSKTVVFFSPTDFMRDLLAEIPSLGVTK